MATCSPRCSMQQPRIPARACSRHLQQHRHSRCVPAFAATSDEREHTGHVYQCKLYDLHHALVPYQQAWGWQHQLVDKAIGAAAQGQASDSVLLLQHPPVYTLGSGSTTDNLRFDPATSPIPLYRTERGGEVTYHGPGQHRPHRPDLHWYLRSLEEAVIVALREGAGLEAERVAGMTGVWVGGHKLAAIGVRAKRWVTYHGLALNVVTDLQPFQHIVPCGIANKPVGSVRDMLDNQCMENDPFLSEMPEGVQSAEELLQEMRYALLDAFQQVFEVELQEADAATDLPGAAELLDSQGAAQRTTLNAAHA